MSEKSISPTSYFSFGYPSSLFPSDLIVVQNISQNAVLWMDIFPEKLKFYLKWKKVLKNVTNNLHDYANAQNICLLLFEYKKKMWKVFDFLQFEMRK